MTVDRPGEAPSAGPRRLPRVSIVDQVAGELLRLIKTELRPGDKILSEPDLADRLGVGRSTVREAKQMLISQGFLEARSKVGTFVATPENRRIPLEMLEVLLTERRIDELHEARNIVEVGAVRLAALHATDAELDALDALLTELDATADDERFWAGTVAFHEMLVRACHNTAVGYMFDSLSAAMREDQLALNATDNDRRWGVELHRRLINAVRTRNPDAAAAAMTDHLEQSHHHDRQVLRRKNGARFPDA